MTDWPAERWDRLPVSELHPSLLVIPLHDLDLDLVRRQVLEGPDADPILVDCRTGDLWVADGRHRALAHLWLGRTVRARLLTAAHQP